MGQEKKKPTLGTDEAAQNQKSDVPGYMEGENYGLFKFNEGISLE